MKMEEQLSLNETASMSSPSALGLNDQSCNECRRRKGRCDRQLPECGPCFRNKRHCLYEKHAKTPLTRKHLTAVEERLRQAELRVRLAERRAQAAEAKLQQSALPVDGGTVQQEQQSSPRAQRSSISPSQRDLEYAASARLLDAGGLRAFNDIPAPEWRDDGQDPDSGLHWMESGTFLERTETSTSMQAHDLEVAPSETDDFSWDEQSTGERPESRHGIGAGPTDDEPSVTDGMASLSVEDRSGYLGVASGAAMLRLLLPDAEHRKPTTRASVTARLRALDPGNPLNTHDEGWVPTPVYQTRNIAGIDLDSAISSYFSLYHMSYPIVHEPTFRAQYSQVLPRPSGRSWNALAYMIGAIGIFTSAKGPVTRDLDLFEAAKSNISIDSLESGNLTLVQVLVLMSNYLQKRNKPNSGYNYLGLALHMAMGLGLHKEFHNWRIAPLAMEIRRRVWWCLQVFAVGAMITFGRPLSWPTHGIEVALPLNVDDRDLTNISISLPPARQGITTYTAVAAQARFHLAANDIYSKVISVNFPSAHELISLDDTRIEAWRIRWHADGDPISPRHRLPRAIMEWRYRNFRIIMYRPFVIRQVLQARSSHSHTTTTSAPVIEPAVQTAIDRCLHETRASIYAICEYWNTHEQNMLTAWYGLYFLFQAALIPCVYLRNEPLSDKAADWREQIRTVLKVLQSMKTVNPASSECHQVISRLSGDFVPGSTESGALMDDFNLLPVEESPQTQLSGVYSMMWPSANQADADDMLMPDHHWNAFFNARPQTGFEPEVGKDGMPWT